MLLMQKKLTTFLLLFVLCLSLTGCPAKKPVATDPSAPGTSQPAPNTDQVRTAARAAATIADAISAAIKIKRTLSTEGKITREEELRLTDILLLANTACALFIEEIKAAKSGAWNESTRQALIASFARLSKALSELNGAQVIGFNNREAQQKFAAILATVNSAVSIIQPLLSR